MVSYFYNGELVSAVRFFSYGKEHRVEFMLHGERYIEQADVLTTERPPAPTRLPERKVGVVGVDLASGEDETVYVEVNVEPKGEAPHKTEAEPNEELDAIEPEPELESELDDFKFIKVTRISNDKSEVFENKEEYDAFVKKHDLDEEAIGRVLDGEQKTHKGFTFENQ